jgi:predicted MFS family arabinose efflux permease
VLLAVAAATAVSTTVLITCAHLRTSMWTLHLAGAALGLASPSPAGIVRARWSHLLASRSRLQVAYSLESVADEVIYVLGPIIVAAAATAVHAAAGLAIAGVLTVTGCVALATQRRTEPPPRRRRPGAGEGAIAGPGILVLVAVFLLLGFVFTAVEVTAVAFADDAGPRGATGPLLSLYALGSMVAGLWYGARRWRAALSRRFRTGLMLLAAGLIPVVLARGLPMMMTVIFFAGLAISPTLIPGFGLVERLVPSDRLTEGLSWLTTALRLGITAGAPLAGWIADDHGASTAFGLPLAAAVLAAIIGVAASGALTAHDEERPPPAPSPRRRPDLT